VALEFEEVESFIHKRIWCVWP